MFSNRSLTTIRPTNGFPWPVKSCYSAVIHFTTTASRKYCQERNLYRQTITLLLLLSLVTDYFAFPPRIIICWLACTLLLTLHPLPITERSVFVSITFPPLSRRPEAAESISTLVYAANFKIRFPNRVRVV
jgi:hypothetical protein